MQATKTPIYQNDNFLGVFNATNPTHATLINTAHEARLAVRSVEYAVNSLQDTDTVTAAARFARKWLHDVEKDYLAAAEKGLIRTDEEGGGPA
jgi:hypothetical protein